MSKLNIRGGNLTVESFDTVNEAQEEGYFDWADEYDWDYKELGKPTLVWRCYGEDCIGTTGLPGRIETTEPNAQAIVTAVNSTYKKGLDPEAYEEVVEALERAQEMILGLGQREKFITKELKKARINE